MIDADGRSHLPPGAEDKLREIFGPGRRLGHVAELPLKRLVQDYCEKFIALDTDGRPAAFLIVSPRSHPDIVADAATRARDVQAALGERLGANVLAPLYVGAPDGRSYSIASYQVPMSGKRFIGRWQRWRLAPGALRWLEDAAATTKRAVADAELDSRTFAPLRAIEGDPKIEAPIRQAAAAAIDEVRHGRWRPSTVVAHNDLWWGNFVQGRPAANPDAPFFIIDWGGGATRGVPIYDVVRLAMSMGLSPARCRSWLDRQALALECRRADALGYLLVAFGALSLHRGEWPEDQFLQAIRACFRYTSDALDMR